MVRPSPNVLTGYLSSNFLVEIMPDDEVRMDRRTFEALASKTRIEILKALDIRHMTVTEIASYLDMAKSSVHEHLEKMLEVGLVEKEESDRKWTYYRLTNKGRQILHPHEATKLLLLLGASILAFVEGIAMLTPLRAPGMPAAAPEIAPAPEAMLAEEGAEALAAEPVAASNLPLALGLILIAASLILGYYAYRRWRRFRPVRFLNIEF